MSVTAVNFFIPCTLLALGAISGSFAGVIAERAYTGQSWKAGRSRCNACTRALGAGDLIPIVSWLVSGGRCSACSAKIPTGYLYMEIALALSFVGAYHVTGLTLALVPFLFALIALAVIVMYDLRHMIVPASFSASLITFALLYIILAYHDLRSLGLTLMIAGVLAFLIFLFYALSGGRIMGLGDTPVTFGLALLTGVLAPSGLIFSFWIGAVVGILVLLGKPRGSRMGIEVPFVPFLAAGFLLSLFTGWNIFPFIGF